MSYDVQLVPPNRSLVVVPIVVGSTGALAWTPPANQGLSYLRIYNSSGAGSISISRSAAVGTGVTLNGPGTITLAPGLYEEWTPPGPVPLNPLYAIGSTSGMNLTIEYATN